MSNKITLIRTIYLYLFSLVGLVLVIIAGVRFIDMGLKAWVFTKAEEDTYRYMSAPLPELQLSTARKNAEVVLECSDKCGFTEDEKAQVKQWLAEYQKWQETSSQVNKIDYRTAQRHRDAANSLAMLIVGLPLYLYHWKMASKKREEESYV